MASKSISPSRTHFFACFLQKSVNLSKKSDLTADTKGNFKITRFEKVRFALQEILCGPIFSYILGIKCRVSGQIHISLKHEKLCCPCNIARRQMFKSREKPSFWARFWPKSDCLSFSASKFQILKLSKNTHKLFVHR